MKSDKIYEILGLVEKYKNISMKHEIANKTKSNVITHIVTINGKKVGIILCLGGFFGTECSNKIISMQNRAQKENIPLIYICDNNGADLKQGVKSLDAYGEVFKNSVMLSGKNLQIMIVAGSCCGGTSYLTALGDFIFFVKESGKIFITGPKVIKEATGEDISLQEISNNMYYIKNGMVDRAYNTFEECFDETKNIIDFFYGVKKRLYLKKSQNGLSELIPKNHMKIYDMKIIINYIFDDESFFEIKDEYAKNVVTGFAKIDGIKVGIVANQPQILSGSVDCAASNKIARFVRTCNLFNIPIITFVDTPGFYPGKEQEEEGIVKHGSKIIVSFAEATVPKLTIILRKAYGGAYIAMNSMGLGADKVIAWFGAEVGIMGAKEAVKILNKDNDKSKINEYFKRNIRIESALKEGAVNEIIAPNETRGKIIEFLEKKGRKEKKEEKRGKE